MSDRLIVRFPWKFRSARLLNKVKSPSTIYRDKVQARNPGYYNEMKVNYRERKKAMYKSVKEMSEKEATEQRKRWRAAKKSQRQVKRTKRQLTCNSQPSQAEDHCQRKRLKLMTQEEKREYKRLKQQESRARRSKQKKNVRSSKGQKSRAATTHRG